MGTTLITLAQDKYDLQHLTLLPPQGYETTFTFVGERLRHTEWTLAKRGPSTSVESLVQAMVDLLASRQVPPLPC